jgi:hypothetical protein
MLKTNQVLAVDGLLSGIEIECTSDCYRVGPGHPVRRTRRLEPVIQFDDVDPLMFAVGSPGNHKSIMNGSSPEAQQLCRYPGHAGNREDHIHRAMTGLASRRTCAATTFSRP